MKPIKFDRHARKRMKDREVTEEEAETAIKYPEYKEPSEKGRTNAYKYIGSRYLRITFKEESDHFLVITVTTRKKSFRRQQL